MSFLDKFFGRGKSKPLSAADVDDSAPGWDAIDAALKPVYGEQKPLHWGTAIKWMIGGPDPLDGTSAYRNDGPPAHWHYVSYGMTELYGKDNENADISGWGFEFTFRLARSEGQDAPPIWAVNFLQNLARYVFESGNAFADGHYIDCNGPIAQEVDTKITAVLFHRDPQLPPIDTPHGRVEFLQVTGVTRDELDASRLWNTTSLLDVMRERNPLLVTNLSRDSILDDPAIAGRIAEGQHRDGSSSSGSYVETLHWSGTDARYVITVTAKGAEGIGLYLFGRTLHGGEFALFGSEQNVAVRPSDPDHVSVHENTLILELTTETARSLAGRLRPERGTYDVLPNVCIEVVPSVIRAQTGEVVEEIG